MKSLARLFLFTFVIVFSSCEPEEMPEQPVVNSNEVKPVDVFGDTGGNERDIIDDKKE